MTDAPPTDEGWFVLHDFRTVDWDAWRDAPERDRDRAVVEGTEYLRRHEAVDDAEEGDSAVFSVLGHKADILIVHFRPTLDALSRAERQFERTALASFTDQPTSYVSVTEVSGYSTPEYFDDSESVAEGTRRYMESKLTPEIPSDGYVCFYPMTKRRGETYNWYDLDMDDRAELMSSHAETGKGYAGRIEQVIASSVGFDDHEWGVTLFADDPTDIKDIVYEMRFDDVSAKYSDFGRFYLGRRFPPGDLGAYLDGEAVPTSGHDETGAHGSEDADSGRRHADDDTDDSAGDRADDDIRERLTDLDIYAGQPHGEDVYAAVLFSEADADDLFDEVDGLRGNFDHYDTHVKTAVYDAEGRDRAAVVSIWDTASAVETAAGFLSELPGVVGRAGEGEGFGTMGMFYTVKPDYREEFVDTFGTVEEVLDGMEGHRGTDLLANVEDGNDMFIASEWDSRENAMAFFRSDDFRETVEWGREVLADRPRHVFLA